MHILEKNLKKAEYMYNYEQSGENALALFACNVLIGKTIGKEGAFLSKAFHVAVTAHQEDQLDLSLLVAVLNANVMLGNYERTYELIRILEAHGSFLSKNMPLEYGQILYFYSIVRFHEERIRSAKKIYRSLEIIYEKTGYVELLTCLAGLQRLIFEDAQLSAKMYLDAADEGFRGVFFLLDVYEVLEAEQEYTPEMNELAKYIIPWALNKDLPIDFILERLEKRKLIEILFSLGTQNLSKIFEKYEHVGAFQCLCQKLIFSEDTSEKALSYYLLAVENELELRGLAQAAAKAAYVGECYDLPLKTAETALRTPTAFDSRQLAFLFSIIIGQKENQAAIAEQRENIIKFGIWALSKNYEGKNFNVIYKYLYDLSPTDERFYSVIEKEVFRSKIEFNGQAPSYVCVYEYAKKGITVWEVDENECYVNSVGNFDCYFLGDEENEYLIISDYKVTKLLNADDAQLLEGLYSRDSENKDVILALAAVYLYDMELNRQKLDVLQRASGLDEISEDFRLDICSHLAEYYASGEQYSLAIHYYTYIGAENIKQKNLENALKTFVSTGKHDAVLSLITRKHFAISDNLIFQSLESLYDKAQTLEIASVCYNLILNGLCSVDILNIVLRKFKGTSDEWLIIANKIDSLGFDGSQLYEKIIVDGIFTGSMGNDSNEAFKALYSKNPGHSVILKYLYFCCYEIIRNGKTLPNDVCEIFEDIYQESDGEKILCVALAMCYIKAGRQDKMTTISEAAMYQKEDGIMFGEFKAYQDKTFISSYIEKNTPFAYFQSPHKNINFCYKTTDRTTYTKKPMKYFKFGMYLICIPLFYGETMTYYFEEENGAKTEVKIYTNQHMRVIEQFDDWFYTVNNAIIYENMMKFDVIEELIENYLASKDKFMISTL